MSDDNKVFDLIDAANLMNEFAVKATQLSHQFTSLAKKHKELIDNDHSIIKLYFHRGGNDFAETQILSGLVHDTIKGLAIQELIARMMLIKDEFDAHITQASALRDHGSGVAKRGTEEGEDDVRF